MSFKFQASYYQQVFFFSIERYSFVLAFSLNKSFALFGYVPLMCASQG